MDEENSHPNDGPTAMDIEEPVSTKSGNTKAGKEIQLPWVEKYRPKR
jgi:hypothetical protein